MLTLSSAGRVSAAPALKPRPADEVVDLAVVFRLVEKARAGSTFPEADLNRVRDVLGQLLDRLERLDDPPADTVRGRKLPAAFERVRTAAVAEKVKVGQQTEAVAVGREGRMTQCARSVLLVAGDAEVVQCHHCVVVAGGTARLTQCTGCLVVAGKAAELGQCFPRKRVDRRAPAGGPDPGPPGTVVVAGERLKCVQTDVGVGLVLRPPGEKGGPAVQSLQCRDLLFLNAPADWKSSQDKECRAVPPKAPFAK